MLTEFGSTDSEYVQKAEVVLIEALDMDARSEVSLFALASLNHR